MQQDNENLFFQYFVDKEKNYYLVVMYEALEKKFEMRRKFWNLLSMTGAVKTRRAYFIFLPMVCLGLNYSKNMTEKKTCIFQQCKNFYRDRS